MPVAEPRAYIVFVHGMAEHIRRYDHFFRKLAAAPHNLHVFAYDQRGHGKTSYDPITETAHEVAQWKADGQPYKLEKNAKRKTGGWAKALPEMEFFVKRESNRAKKTNGKLFLYGHSMVSGAQSRCGGEAAPIHRRSGHNTRTDLVVYEVDISRAAARSSRLGSARRTSSSPRRSTCSRASSRRAR